VTPRLGLLVSGGYLFARPEVAGQRVKADAIRAQLGVAYAIF
jgi:hypothetical protein